MWYNTQAIFWSIVNFLMTYVESAETALVTGFTLVLLASSLFVLQINLGSLFLSVLRWPVSALGLVEKRGLSIIFMETNKVYIYPLWLSQLVFFYYLFQYGNTGCVVLVHLDLSFVPINAVDTYLCFYLDDMSAGFLATTGLIGCVVNRFVPYYMKNESLERRFTLLLNAFLFSMLFLIMSSNFFSFLLFWEMIGVFSYFLINFWTKKGSTFKSASKALLFNLTSDVLLAYGMVQYYWWFGTYQFPAYNMVAVLDMEGRGESLTSLLMPLFLAASCKSVQFMYHFWLPDSMDAPVPASALIHSATLVAAGILLILRIKPILTIDLYVPAIHSYIALLTVVVGGIAAASQTDLKKILAYSTISNCGYMMFLAVNSTEWATLIFFISHGLLKAMSFLFIGFIVMLLKHKQDYKYAGHLAGLYQGLFYGTAFSVATLGSVPTTIMGLVKHRLFYDGAPILTDPVSTQVALGVGGISAMIYSVKIIFYVFLFSRNKWQNQYGMVRTAMKKYIWRTISFQENKMADTILMHVLGALVQSFLVILLLYTLYLNSIRFDMLLDSPNFNTNWDTRWEVFYVNSTAVEFMNTNFITNERHVSNPVKPRVVRILGFVQTVVLLGMTIPLWSGAKRRQMILTSATLWMMVLYMVIVR